MKVNPLWLIEAFNNLNEKEIKGDEDNSKIVSWWKRIFRGGIKDDETPWCAAFVGAMLEGVGIKSSRFESAGSYRTWGVPLSQPTYGAICVLSRPGGNHVAFCVGRTDDGKIALLGGNQGDTVSVMVVDRKKIDSWRWPANAPMPEMAPMPLYAGVPNLENMA